MRVTLATLVLAAVAALLLAAVAAVAQPQPRYPDNERHERVSPPPQYLPNSERTRRRYLPGYQFEQERRRICGSYCEHAPRRPRPFER